MSRELLPLERTWRVPPVWWTYAMIAANGQVGRYMLVCPNLECGNADTTQMKLYSTDLDTCQYYPELMPEVLMNETPRFVYSKSAYTEAADMPDTVECVYCHEEWEVTTYTHYYEYG